MAEKKSGDPFTAEKFRWFNQVSSDHKLTPLCFHVAYKISRWLRRETREGWHSQEHLAVDCGVTVNGVRGALKQLCQRGHLIITTGGGRGHASVYKFNLKPAEKGNGGCPFVEEKDQQPLPLSEDKGATTVHERGNSRSNKGATTVTPNPLRESFNESLEYISTKKTASKKSNLEVSEDFQEFWINYPRREAKKEAERAYEKARLSASRSEILSGAMKYFEARQEQDHTFIKLPATWLNKECWTDETPIPHQKRSIGELVYEATHSELAMPFGFVPTTFEKPPQTFDDTPTGIPILDNAFATEPQILGMFKTISNSAKERVMRELQNNKVTEAKRLIIERASA